MMGSGFYGELSKQLRKAGCRPIRQGKGSHEIWLNPETGLSFTVPVTVKSHHTANEILKQAGLPKAF
jgi:predicted RNA binding protein YcfA (HicA-like mRNA interferase family)